MNNIIRLENQDLLCLLGDNGVIYELRNKKENASLITAGGNLTGWKMISDSGPWREHPIFDADNRAVAEAGPEKAVLRFDGLTGGEGLRQDFKVTMTYELSGAELQCQIEAYNNSGDTLREIWFPFLSGVRELDRGEAHHLVVNFSTGMIMDDPLANLPRYDGVNFGNRPGGKFATYGFGKYPLLYPGTCSMPWTDFYNSRQGWYLGCHDMETPSAAILMRAREKENDMQLGFARYPFVRPGQAWSSGKVVIRCHEGGWRAGARRYAEFAKTKLRNPEAPEWLRNSPGFQIVFCIGQNRRVHNTYDYIYEAFRANGERGLNLPLLVFGWVKRGFDNGYPELEPDERIGGAEKLRGVIAKVRAEGGKVILYTQGRLIDFCTDFYKEIGKDCCVVSEDGTPYMDEYSFNSEATLYPNRLFAVACPSSPQWKNQLKRQIDIVSDLGADGILFDQIGADNPFICFGENHGHGSPDMAFNGKIAALRELRGYAAGKRPDFAVVGELICDVFLQELDITHGWATQESAFGEAPPAGVRVTPEIYRYVLPRHRPSSRMCASRNDYGRAFVNGLVLEHYIGKDAGLLEYVVGLQKLRASLMDFFNGSVFADEDGISYQNPDFIVKHYIGDSDDSVENGGHGVRAGDGSAANHGSSSVRGEHGFGVANLSDRRQTVRVAAPFLKPGAALQLRLPSGGVEAVSADGGAFSVTLDAQTAAFLIA